MRANGIVGVSRRRGYCVTTQRNPKEPRWLVEEYAAKLGVFAVRLGPEGIHKQILRGIREGDAEISYLQSFVSLATSPF